MKKIGVFFGSTTGATARIAREIGSALGAAAVQDISEANPGDLEEYDLLILGTSTWGVGDLQDDWEQFDLDQADLKGKKVALFGLGDAESFGGTFVDGMGAMYDAVTARGAAVIAAPWPVDGYDFDDSAAVRDGSFVGLALDEDNQDDLTDERVDRWISLIKATA